MQNKKNERINVEMNNEVKKFRLNLAIQKLVSTLSFVD